MIAALALSALLLGPTQIVEVYGNQTCAEVRAERGSIPCRHGDDSTLPPGVDPNITSRVIVVDR